MKGTRQLRNSDDIIDSGRRMDPYMLSENCELARCDGLRINIDVVYDINPDSIQTWRLSYPTRDVRFRITVPHNYRVICTIFAKTTHGNDFVITPHSWDFHSHTWMLRKNGFVYRVFKQSEDEKDGDNNNCPFIDEEDEPDDD